MDHRNEVAIEIGNQLRRTGATGNLESAAQPRSVASIAGQTRTVVTDAEPAIEVAAIVWEKAIVFPDNLGTVRTGRFVERLRDFLRIPLSLAVVAHGHLQ